MRQMTVKEIDDKGKRILLYGNNPDYHLIANSKADVKIGDIVEYEPYGANFGWFIRVISPSATD